MYSRICLLGILMGFFLLGGNNLFSQQQKGFDMGKLYDIAIKKYLLPSDNHSESILYLEKPSFEPENSIQIVVLKDSFQLVGYSFKESYWVQLFRHIQEYRNAEFEPEVDHYSVLVSKKFNKTIQSVFSQTIKSRKLHSSKSNEMVVDGTTYLFRLKNSSLEVWSPKASEMSFKTAAICSTIMVSLKNNNFNEKKIILAIEESGF